MLAVLHVEDVCRPDREAEAEAVFGTTNREHPGVAQLLNRTGPAYVGGRVEGACSRYRTHDYKQLRRTPAELRYHVCGSQRAWPAGVAAADEGAAGRRRSQNSASLTTLLIRSVRACGLTPYLSASIRSSVSSSMSGA